MTVLLPAGAYAEPAAITAGNWGSVTTPVYGSSEAAPYTNAELFAGPMKFGPGNYFSGVLPNGRMVTPAGVSAQVGMNPLGVALSPDGRFLVSSNDDERDGGIPSLANATNVGGYSLSVIDTSTMKVVSQIKSGPVFIGLQVTGAGPYTVWASGGPDNNIKLFSISTSGIITGAVPASIPINPITPSNQGFVSNYTPAPNLNLADQNGNKRPAPTNFNRTTGDHITFPAGSVLSPNSRFLFVACNGDNSLAVIDTVLLKVVSQYPVGYFPYGVSISRDGNILVSNWGVSPYRFFAASYQSNQIAGLSRTGQNSPYGFYVPTTSRTGIDPHTSSISLFRVSLSNAAMLTSYGSYYLGHPLDALYKVGDTHPSASATVYGKNGRYLYVTKSNIDSVAIISLNKEFPGATAFNDAGHSFDLAPLQVTLGGDQKIHGSYPDAIVISPDNTRAYIAEAGINSVAVLDTTDPAHPSLLGRIPTGWYPTSLAISADGKTLYVANAKGIGEDINPKTVPAPATSPTGVESFSDSNFIFGSVQKIDLTGVTLNNTTVLNNNFAVHAPADTSVVPVGGGPSSKIKHVFFILHENKTFDSMLGNGGAHFGPFASINFNKADGSVNTDPQFTGVSLNTQRLAAAFATGVNYFSESEESDAGHQFCASGTATDYTEKTLLVKSGRGVLVNKNFEPEDYPESGYIFNNAARNGVTFRDYGAMIRIAGTDTGTSTPTVLNDPLSGLLGYPVVKPDATTTPATNRVSVDANGKVVSAGDVNSNTSGLGQSYFLALPVLAVLGTYNPTGEFRIDGNYPGYNFNISDQRRALEFNKDFDRMLAKGTLPQFLYIYQPNDHTGGAQAPNQSTVGATAAQQVADGDVGLGMVVQHIMKSPVYYDPATGEGSAIFMTYDDAQSTLDHIHQHRTPLVVISPYAKPGFVAARHYSTASIVKTEELLLGLPPNNLGDLLATDLRDMFQSTPNNILPSSLSFTRLASYHPSPEGKHIWTLVKNLDTSAPDRDSHRLGALTRLSMKADELYRLAVKQRQLKTATYRSQQAGLYQAAVRLVKTTAPRDTDD